MGGKLKIGLIVVLMSLVLIATAAASSGLKTDKSVYLQGEVVEIEVTYRVPSGTTIQALIVNVTDDKSGKEVWSALKWYGGSVGYGDWANFTVYWGNGKVDVDSEVGTDDTTNMLGNYTIHLIESTGKGDFKVGNTTITIVPAPKSVSLADLGVLLVKLNKTVLRADEDLSLGLFINKTKMENMSVYTAVISKSNWTNITKDIEAGKPLNNLTIVNNAYGVFPVPDDKSVSVSTVDCSNLEGEYYVVLYNVTVSDYVDMYNAAASFIVKPKYTPANLSDLGVKLNVSDVDYGKVVKLQVDATKEVNLAIVDSTTWDKLHANISTLTKADVFSSAKWYKENFKGNETFEVSTVDYGLNPGDYVIVVFNTTDDYVYCYNNSTTFKVYPIPRSVGWEELGIEDIRINATTLDWGDTLKLTIIRSTYTPINVVVINETNWAKINKSMKVYNSTIMNNATKPYGWNTTGSVEGIYTISGLLPDKYVIVIYNTTTLSGESEKYMNLYNDSLTFEVLLMPEYVSMSDLNVTLTINKTTIDYGDIFKLTVNVTDSANVNIAILNTSAWSELESKSSIKNASVFSKSKWNMSEVTANSSWKIYTANNLTPNEYVIVVYNTKTAKTASGNVEYVNAYNDDLTFKVVSATEKVDLSELGVDLFYLNKTTVNYGEGVRLAIGWNEGVKEMVNIVLLNVTEWSDIIGKTPDNKTIFNAAEWKKMNINESFTDVITANFAPDEYVFVVYREMNGVLTKYNDDKTLTVKFVSTAVNLTDLVKSLEIIPEEVTAGENALLIVEHKPGVTNFNIAIIEEETWNKMGTDNLLNDTVANASAWFAPLTGDIVETVNTSGWDVGNYIVLVYNVTKIDGKNYVKCYNDSVTFNVTKQACDVFDWTDWEDDGVIADEEIQAAVYYWITDTPVNGHVITVQEIQTLVYWWQIGYVDVC